MQCVKGYRRSFVDGQMLGQPFHPRENASSRTVSEVISPWKHGTEEQSN